jgi:hypothetical protein
MFGSYTVGGGVLDGIWSRRTRCLRDAYLKFKGDSSGIDFSKFELSKDLMGRIVDHYISDYQILRIRYKIESESRVQLHRVAGLFVSAIMRYRPIFLLPGQVDPTEPEVRINEKFAVYTGLAICAEKAADNGVDTSARLAQSNLLGDWIKRTEFMLETRNLTSEGLIAAFHAISIYCFPENFEGQNS